MKSHLIHAQLRIGLQKIIGQLNLLARLKCRHSQVRTRRTTESISQIALKKQTKIIIKNTDRKINLIYYTHTATRRLLRWCRRRLDPTTIFGR